MKAVRNMVNSFAELKVCAETVELLKQMGIKKPMLFRNRLYRPYLQAVML